jgi:CIC family chloride channel protein
LKAQIVFRGGSFTDSAGRTARRLLISVDMETSAEPTGPNRTSAIATPLFSLLAIAVGLVAGAGAVVFRALIALFHNALFLARFRFVYDATVHTPPSPLGPLVIAVPVVGALAVAFLVKNFAPEAKGHGVPEVMDAIYYNQGKIRPAVAVIKSLASALSIGSGGSVGREGPIVQIGSSFGSMLGTLLRLPPWQRITLIAGGAGGGIGATFNTPVGGILFAMELMLHEVSARTLVPVAISTVTATWLGQVVFGPHPSFVVPALETFQLHLSDPPALLAYAALGVVAGLVSALFITSLYGFEHFFESRVGGSYYRQHMLGMLGVGLLMYGTMAAFGHYYIEGVGYATIQDVLSSVTTNATLLGLLFLLKLTATSLTLGSGASGGVFSPALFMGATVGGACGAVLQAIAPKLGISPPAFALAGMAGVVGGTTGAPVTAIVMLFEMTLDYTVIIPMTLTVAISYGVRRAISPQSIYTKKLALRGHPTPEALQTNFLAIRPARELADTSVALIPVEVIEQRGREQIETTGRWLLAVAGDLVVAVIPHQCRNGRRPQRTTEAGRDWRELRMVDGDTPFAEVARVMARSTAEVCLVVHGGKAPIAGAIVGVIDKSRIADALGESIEALEI